MEVRQDRASSKINALTGILGIAALWWGSAWATGIIVYLIALLSLCHVVYRYIEMPCQNLLRNQQGKRAYA